jgi:hypothetical protein
LSKRGPKKEEPKLDPYDEANALPNQPNHFVSIKPKEEQGYMYRKFHSRGSSILAYQKRY